MILDEETWGERWTRQCGGLPQAAARLVQELRPFLGADVTLCLDMGSFHLWIARHL
jgi:acetolactate synthase I/II/III large subunit